MIKVYHRVAPEFLNPTVPVHFPEGFLLVATVSKNQLDKAFELTNHIDHNWIENEDVEVHVSRARSSSVGDVFEREKDGVVQRFMCESIGWTELTNELTLLEFVRFLRGEITDKGPYGYRLIHKRHIERLDEILKEFEDGGQN